MAAVRKDALAPLRERIGYRPEHEDDDAFLRALYASTRAEEMALTDWIEEQKDAFLRMQFDLQRAHYRRHYTGASFLVILVDGEKAGRLYVHRGSRDMRLMDVALLHKYRGSGIGTCIVSNLLAEAAQLAMPMTLYVEPYNPALRLYQRLGFRTIEQSDTNLFMEWRPPASTQDLPAVQV
jgi:ribosomal protein S18 acetylase RimI-like enzyme